MSYNALLYLALIRPVFCIEAIIKPKVCVKKKKKKKEPDENLFTGAVRQGL